MPRLSYEYKHIIIPSFNLHVQRTYSARPMPVPEPEYEGLINVNTMSERRNALPGILEDTSTIFSSYTREIQLIGV